MDEVCGFFFECLMFPGACFAWFTQKVRFCTMDISELHPCIHCEVPFGKSSFSLVQSEYRNMVHLCMHAVQAVNSWLLHCIIKIKLGLKINL